MKAECNAYNDHSLSMAPWEQNIDVEPGLKYRTMLILNQIYHLPNACKQGFVSYAHSDADIDRTLEATELVLQSHKAPAPRSGLCIRHSVQSVSHLIKSASGNSTISAGTTQNRRKIIKADGIVTRCMPAVLMTI